MRPSTESGVGEEGVNVGDVGKEKSQMKFSQKGAMILTTEKWQDCLATKKIHLASEMIDLS